MRLPTLALILLFALSLAQSWIAYPDMPDRMASHFGAGGQADGFSSKDTFFTLFSFLDAMLVAMFLGLPLLVSKLPPSMVNLPNRDYWLAPERREEAQRRITGQMAWFGVATMLFMILVKQTVIAANAGAGESGDASLGGLFGWGLAGYLVYTLVWIVGLYRTFRIPQEAPA